MVYGPLGMGALKEMVALPIKKVGRALKFYVLFCFVVFFLVRNAFKLSRQTQTLYALVQAPGAFFFLHAVVTRIEAP